MQYDVRFGRRQVYEYGVSDIIPDNLGYAMPSFIAAGLTVPYSHIQQILWLVSTPGETHRNLLDLIWTMSLLVNMDHFLRQFESLIHHVRCSVVHSSGN